MHVSGAGKAPGEQLSNTWTTYPYETDNLGKLRTIRRRLPDLEWREFIGAHLLLVRLRKEGSAVD